MLRGASIRHHKTRSSMNITSHGCRSARGGKIGHVQGLGDGETMKTWPGRTHGRTRLARALGLDRNPLRRGTDRAEAWIRIGLLATFLIAGPTAALGIGHAVYHAEITVARGPAGLTRQVKPVLQRQAPTITDSRRISQADRAGIQGEGTGSSARSDQVLAAFMTLAATALALLVVLRLAVMLLSRRRLAAWEAAWSRVGPQWSKRRT
jgi:hypothetical protein